MVSTSGSALLPLPLSRGYSRSSAVASVIASNTSNSWICRQRKIICSCMTPSRNVSDGLSPYKFTDSSDTKILNSVEEPESDSDVLIESRIVYKSFGEKHILRGVSFKIRHGEAVGIIGPSGTGKSTILKIIAGLLAPDKGQVYVRGKKREGLISDEEISISGLRIGLVFQSAALFDSLTVRENVGFLLYENSKMSDELISERVTETLAAVGLKEVEDRLPSELSGGMKNRVALARSIIFDTTKDTVEPEVLLYDEPKAGLDAELDPIASTVVEDLIKGEDALGKSGKVASYVVVTHQHSTIRRAVDRMSISVKNNTTTGNFSTCIDSHASAKGEGKRKLPVLLFDVMDTIVRDPFYEDVPAFFGMN